MSDKKRGQRPPVPMTLGTGTHPAPEPEGYSFSFRVTPADSHLIAQVAHRHGVTPGDVMQRGVNEFLAALRTGAIR